MSVETDYMSFEHDDECSLLSLYTSQSSNSNLEALTKPKPVFLNRNMPYNPYSNIRVFWSETFASPQCDDGCSYMLADFLAFESSSVDIIAYIKKLSEKDKNIWRQKLGNIYPEFSDKFAVTSLIGSFCVSFVIYGTMNGLLGSLRHLLERYHNNSTLNLVFIIYFTLSFSLMPLCDFCNTKFKIRTSEIVPIGALVFAFGLLCLSCNWSKSYGLFISISVIMSTGTSILASPIMASVGTWYQIHLGKAQSTVTVGGGIGTIVMPYIFSSIAETQGIFNACLFLLLLCLIFLTIAVFLIKDNHKYIIAQELCNNDIDSIDDSSKYIYNYNLKSSEQIAALWKKIKEELNKYGILQSSFVLVVISSAIAENSVGYVQLNIEEILSLTNIEQHLIKKYFAIMNSSGVVGRIIFGVLADLIISPNILQTIGLVLSILTTSYLWIPDLFQSGTKLKVILVIQGFIFNGIYSITAACVSRVSEKKDFSKRFSVLYMVESFVCLPLFKLLAHKLKKGLMFSFQTINAFLIVAAVTSLFVPICYFYKTIAYKFKDFSCKYIP
ncbi:hypothetical protein QEN19_004061 [Hanseniaspora menglaensis]